MTAAHQPAPTDRQREAARTASRLVATREAATAELTGHGADSATLMGLRASAEAIGAGRTSWDDLPPDNWVAFTACLFALASSPHLTPGEREDCLVLAMHYRTRTTGAKPHVIEQLQAVIGELASQALGALDERLADDPEWQAARGGERS